MTKYTFEVEATVNERLTLHGPAYVRRAQPNEVAHQHSVYRRPVSTQPGEHALAQWLADCGTADAADLLVAALEARQAAREAL